MSINIHFSYKKIITIVGLINYNIFESIRVSYFISVYFFLVRIKVGVCIPWLLVLLLVRFFPPSLSWGSWLLPTAPILLSLVKIHGENKKGKKHLFCSCRDCAKHLQYVLSCYIFSKTLWVGVLVLEEKAPATQVLQGRAEVWVWEPYLDNQHVSSTSGLPGSVWCGMSPQKGHEGNIRGESEAA